MEYKVISILYSASVFRQFKSCCKCTQRYLKHNTHFKLNNNVNLEKKRLWVADNERTGGQEGEHVPR